jgi:methylmalonyl-CoA mutase cobalamin-binding subunit
LNFDAALSSKPFAHGNTGRDAVWAHPWQPEELAICTGAIEADDVLALAKASLQDMPSALRCVSDWVRQGRPIEAIYLDGIAAAARLQGLWWTRDQLDFSALTVGCSRLHRLLYELSPLFLADAPPLQDATVLMLPEPDSQHTMGLFMLSEFFRRAGWRTLLLQPDEVADTVRMVSSNWVDVLAISISSDRHFETLQRMVVQARLNSPNPKIQIVAGGPMAALMPEVLLALGVDWVGTDAQSTVEQARSQLPSMTNS